MSLGYYTEVNFAFYILIAPSNVANFIQSKLEGCLGKIKGFQPRWSTMEHNNILNIPGIKIIEPKHFFRLPEQQPSMNKMYFFDHFTLCTSGNRKPLMCRIECKFRLISTSYFSGLFYIIILLHI